jgi:DNA-directed RNA polymerase specialized sigma24 family protein
MDAVNDGSVSGWLGDLKEGDLAAAQPLWERYFGKLVELARKNRRGLRPGSAGEDEEDAALSAFNSFCEGVARGRFPRLADRDDLWRILVMITARKSFAQIRRAKRLKRGGGRVLTETALRGRASVRDAAEGSSQRGLEWIPADGPTPEFAAMMSENFQNLLNALDNDELRKVAIARMEGYTVDEIAESLRCARRTVARRLDLIRTIWLDTSSHEVS